MALVVPVAVDVVAVDDVGLASTLALLTRVLFKRRDRHTSGV